MERNERHAPEVGKSRDCSRCRRRNFWLGGRSHTPLRLPIRVVAGYGGVHRHVCGNRSGYFAPGVGLVALLPMEQDSTQGQVPEVRARSEG